MKRDFRYKLNKSSRRITWIILSLLLAFVVFSLFYSNSGYLPAWFMSLGITVLALYILSIPRFVRVDDDSLEIHCIVELTKIAVEDIKEIKRIDTKELKYTIPLLGSYGFFGYYGYYYNFAEMSIFKIYVSKWDSFVRIEDIYEDVYIINCDDPDEMIHLIEQAKQNKSII